MNYNPNIMMNQPALPLPPKEEEKKAPFLDFMGLSLEFDDVLIIGVLLFLYFEGVDDIMLYIILVLLLIG
jgi:hypothetical protein